MSQTIQSKAISQTRSYSTQTWRRKTVRAAVGAVLACALPLAAIALPVIPGASGYGMDTPAGRGGTVYKVTNLNESGEGSLRACVDKSGPRVCVFEVSGTISLSSDLVIRNPYITIAGQTAPSPGVMIRGGGLWVKSSEVLVQHLRVRPGDGPVGSPPENRDALKISSTPDKPLKNIVLDHCSFNWAIDETASLMYDWDAVTMSNNIVGEPLHESLHPSGPHGFGILIEQGRVTMVGNLLVSNQDRNPHSRAPHLVFVNNVIYNPNSVIKLGTTGSATQTTVAGNVFIPGPDTTRGQSMVQIRAGGEDALPAGSKVFLADNVGPGATDDPWSMASYYTIAGDITKYRAATPPTWPANLTRLPAAKNVVLESVLKNAGARPADRDSVEKRIVDGVRKGTGRFINCVEPNGTARCERNGGGWPNLGNNRRALTIPSDPNAVTASGYTNLEVWLHKMAAEVEGRSSPPVAPKLTAGR